MGARGLRSNAVAAVIAGMGVATCLANPIPADDAVQADASAGLAAPGASAARGGSVGDRHASFSSDPDDKQANQERADAMASTRDPTVLPIDVQGVGAQAHPSPSALPKKQDVAPGEDGDGLKNFARTARDWMHDVFGRPDNLPDNAAEEPMPGAPGAHGDLGLPVETQSSGVTPMAQRNERPVEMPAPEAGPHRASPGPVRESAGARLLADSAPEYSIQQALKRCRQVLVHPLTWLVIVLIAGTRFMMSRNRR